MFGIQSIRVNDLKFFIEGTRVVVKEIPAALKKEWAHRVKDQLVANIEYNAFDMPENEPKYLAWKEKQGLSGQVLIATGEYIQAIQVLKIGGDWYVGIPANLRHSGSKLMMAELAKVLEYGSPAKGIPARPVWALTRAQADADVRDWAEALVARILSGMAGMNVGKGRGGHRLLRMKG